MSTRRLAPQAEVTQAAWRRGQGPDIDAVLFGDGSLIVMNLWRFQESDNTSADRHPPAAWLPELTATAWTATDWLDLDTYNHAARHGQLWAIAGEASAHGSIGFVAMVAAPGEDQPHANWRTCAGGGQVPATEDHTLHWLIVSRYSNPFFEVDIDDTEVRARSTLDECWTIPRYAPQCAKITRLAHDLPLR